MKIHVAHALAFSSFLGVLAAQSPAPVLLKDINPQVQINPSSDPQDIVQVGPYLFFSANLGPDKNQSGGSSANAKGRELYRSLGVPNTTTLVKDILPGPSGSMPKELFAHGSTLYFQADDGKNGFELWKSDGTAAGTVMVKDIRPGSTGAYPRSFVALDANTVLFAADDGAAGNELWRTDGTAKGTYMVKDINPGASNGVANNSIPSLFTKVGNQVFFQAFVNGPGMELWKTDGTATGTVLVKDIFPGTSPSSPQGLTAVGTTLFFSAMDSTANGNELWKSDGTANGTVMVKDIDKGFASSLPRNLVAMGNTLYFQARVATLGPELWKSDGTANGTVMVKDIHTGTGGSSPADLTVVGSTLYFNANNGTVGYELWKSDGTVKGTVLVKDIQLGANNSYPMYLTASGNELYFTADDGVNGYELWKSNGTQNGTILVKDMYPGSTKGVPNASTPTSLVAGTAVKVFFAAEDGQHGRELWSSRGTAARTQLVTDVNPPMQGASKDAWPKVLTTVAGLTYFAADDGKTGSELWKTDGTAKGTVMVQDIWPGGVGSVPNASTPARFFGYGGVVLFTAADGASGLELWKTDGTVNGTVMVKDIFAGIGSSLAYEFTLFKGAVWFRADDGKNGAELWKTDGTANGTVMLRDLNPGFSGSVPSQLVVVGDRMFFKALTRSGGAELWVTDGTANGTVMVKDIASGLFSSNPHFLARLKDKVYFSATDFVSGYELWVSDGTAKGTVMVKDISPGGGSSSPVGLTVAGNTIYFRGNDGKHGPELWKSDGTAQGTVMVKDIWPGSGWGYPTYLQPLAGGQKVVFAARDGITSPWSGIELWVSDGTAKGTMMVKDINPGAASSMPVFVTPTGDRWVYFRAENGSNGSELWRTDGTANGTTMVADLNKGKLGSSPGQFAINKGRLLFAANDGAAGHEIWTVELPASNQHVGAGCALKGDRPVLSGSDPVMGRNVAVRISRAPARSMGVMLVGLPVQRPLNLGGGCALFVNTNLAPVVLTFPVDGNGGFLLSQPVPNDTALKGVTAALQAGVGPTATGPFGLDLTNGLHLTVGN